MVVIAFVGVAQIKKGGVYAHVDSLKNGYIIWFENDTVLSSVEISNTFERGYGHFSWSKKDTRRLIEEMSKWEYQSGNLLSFYRGNYKITGNHISFYPEGGMIVYPPTLEVVNRKRIILGGATYNYVLSVK